MVKLIVCVGDGRQYYVMKESRQTPSSTRRSRIYRDEVIEEFKTSGAIIEMVVAGERIAFIEQSVPQLAGGRASGFWQFFKKQKHYKHASTLGTSFLIICKLTKTTPLSFIDFIQGNVRKAVEELCAQMIESSKRVLPSIIEFSPY